MAAEWVKIQNINSYKVGLIYLGLSLVVFAVSAFAFASMEFEVSLDPNKKAVEQCGAAFDRSMFYAREDEGNLRVTMRSLEGDSSGGQALSRLLMRTSNCQGMRIESFCFGQGCTERASIYYADVILSPRGGAQ